MFYFNISINYCTGCKYGPHPWLALGAFGAVFFFAFYAFFFAIVEVFIRRYPDPPKCHRKYVTLVPGFAR